MRATRVLFTGLDDCLLDATTHDYDAARPALAALARLRVPLVLCSSRTRAEVGLFTRLLGLAAPFIVENGATLVVPLGHLERGVPGGCRDGDFEVLRLGADKGLAVRTLLSLYAREGTRPAAIGLGSREVDLTMLRAVDRPIVVPGPGGWVDPRLALELPRAEQAPHPGPAGWNNAVLGVLNGRRLPTLETRLPRAPEAAFLQDAPDRGSASPGT